jgi:hypothetical protein
VLKANPRLVFFHWWLIRLVHSIGGRTDANPDEILDVSAAMEKKHKI